MPEYRISVVVDSTQAVAGSRVTESSLQTISTAANRTKDTVAQLTRAFDGIGTAAGRGLSVYQSKARVVEVSLQRLGALATSTAQKMQQVFAANANVGGASSGFGDLKKILDAKGRAEIEQLIGGFNRTAVASTNARTALSNFSQTSVSSSRATSLLKSQVGQLAAGFATLAAARAVISGAIELSNTYGNLQNRLAQVTASSEDLASVSDRLLSVANESGAAFEDVGGTYARVRGSLDKLGFSSSETIEFTENLTKALASSGKTGAETSAAMTQLSQALASGKLQGDEFRTITEAFPELLDIVAKQMGVATTKVKELSSEGKITAKVLADSLIDAGDQIDARFAKRIPTAAQAFQVFKNELLRLVGEGTRALGPFLLQIAEGVSQAAKELGPLVSEFGRVAGAIGQVVASPWIDFLKESVTQTLAAYEATEKMVGAVSSLASISGDEALKVLFTPETVTTILEEVNATKSLADAVALVIEAKDQQRQVEAGFKTAREALAKFDKSRADDDERVAKRQTDLVKFVQVKLRQSMQEATKLHNAAAAAARKHNDELAKTLDNLFPIQAALREQAEIASNLNELIEREFITREEATEAFQRWTELHRAALDPIGAMEDAIERQREQALLSKDALAIENREREIANQLIAQGIDLITAQLEAERLARLEREAASARGRSSLATIAREGFHSSNLGPLDRERVSSDEVRKTRAELDALYDSFLRNRAASGDFTAAFSLGLDDLKTEILDVASLISSAMLSAFRGVEDAIVDLVTKGEADFASLTQSILADMTRILIRMLTIKAIGSIFGGGSFGAAAANIPVFATGGRFTVGGSGGTDSQFVAFRATPGERVDVLTPEQQRRQAGGVDPFSGGGRGGPVAPTTVQVVAQIAPETLLDVVDSPRGRRRVVGMVESRPGSLNRMRG